VTALRVPVTRSEPSQSLVVLLDGVRYRISLDWNGRIGRWLCALTHADSGRVVFTSRVLATRSDLLKLYRFSPDCPPGILSPIDLSGLDREASFSTLGADDGIALVYFTAT
jgi:hypothetical protein